MGAVSFSLDLELVRAIKSVSQIGVLVETGTFEGATVSGALPFFDQLYTIELSPELCSKANSRFENESKVKVFEGSSPAVLAQLRPQLENSPVLYWLDAHWCVAASTAGEQSQCPLLLELSALSRLNDESIVLIDDARLFLCPPQKPHEVSQWPKFDEIVKALFALNSNHELMVVNDVIAFFPARYAEAFSLYARGHGIDWLAATHEYRNKTDQQQVIRRQKKTIQTLEERIRFFESSLINRVGARVLRLARRQSS